MRKTGRPIKTRWEKVPTADSVRIQQLTDWCEEEWISVRCETLHSEHSGVASCSVCVSVCLHAVSVSVYKKISVYARIRGVASWLRVSRTCTYLPLITGLHLHYIHQ